MCCPKDITASHLADSLYKHLVYLVSENQEYQPLLASWELEQPQYTSLLENVVHSFPTYTRHNHLHSARVVSNIEMILGDERIKCLGPTDTWLLLQCAYSHDTGMVIAEEEIKQFIDNGELQRHVNDLRDKGGEYAKAAHAFDEERLNKQLGSTSKWTEPIETQRSVMMVLSSFFRKRHGINSKNRIEAELEERTYKGVFPKRIRRLVGDINRVHTTDLQELMQLKKATDGFGRDCAHPRFVASLLRLGDLLDVDNNRLNPYQISISQQPSDAKSHFWKHKALEHIRISPEYIELDFDFRIDDSPVKSKTKNDDNENRRIVRDACKLARECYISLQNELKHLALYWQEIAPPKFPGSAPLLKESSIKLDGRELSSEDFDLRYEISHVRACEIIQGVGLYDEPLTFIRELIQNAMDATKIRVFEDLRSGVYGNLPNYEESEKELNLQDIKPLLLPHLNNLGICLEIETQIDSSKNHIVTIQIRDSGMGITLKKLHKMKHIGNIYDSEYEENVEEMPMWMRPTGSFGIGLQSVFRYADIFEMSTFSREENQKLNIQFFTTKLGGEIIYLPDKKNKQPFLPGTEVIVRIEDNNFPWEDLARQMRQENQSDIFSTGYETRLEYIKQYLINQLKEDIFPIFLDYIIRDIHTDKIEFYYKNTEPFVKSIFSESWTDTPIEQEYPQDDLFEADWNSLSFIHWSKNNNIAVRCTLLFAHTADEEIHKDRIETRDLPLLGKSKISYRGMHVKNIKHDKELQFPLCDVDAYLMFGKAKDILHTSRDGLLDEKVTEIKKMINDTIFNGISNLLLSYWKNIKRSQDEENFSSDPQYNAWKNAHKNLTGKQAFILALAIKERIAICERQPTERSGELLMYKELLRGLTNKLSSITVPARNISGGASTDVPEFSADNLFDENKKHWFTQTFYHGTRVELAHAGIKEENSIIYTIDFYSKLSTQFYWNDVFFIQQKDEHPVAVYTHGNLPREHINLSSEDIEMLFKKAYSDLNKNDSELKLFFIDRPIFPALPGFETLCVRDDIINTNHLRNCGTYIIAPFNASFVKEHMTIDSLNSNEKVKNVMTKIIKDHSFKNVLKHVLEHSICERHKNKKAIEHSYKRFVKYFIDIIIK